MESILGIRACPVEKITLCVTSDAELTKCIKMRVSLHYAILLNINKIVHFFIFPASFECPTS